MSITVAQPAMALNSSDVPGATYRMWNTWEVKPDEDIDHILGWTAAVAKGAPGGKLKMVILNCHGFYRSGVGGYGLKMGKGIYRSNLTKFAVLNGLVENIWITACGAARMSPADWKGDGDGNVFCSEMAKQSGAYVVAATTHQDGDVFLAKNHVDNFEGLVLQYGPMGNVTWSHDYGRSWMDSLIHGCN
jgi:hypothetical protein